VIDENENESLSVGSILTSTRLSSEKLLSCVWVVGDSSCFDKNTGKFGYL